MNKIEFLQTLKDRGNIKSAEDAQKAIDTWRNAGRGFDDDPEQPEQIKQPQQQGQSAQLQNNNMRPSQAIGAVAKGVGNYLIGGLPDFPEAAGIAYNTIKQGAKSLGDIFNSGNYANIVNNPIEAAKGALKGVGNLGYGLAQGTFQSSPDYKAIKATKEALGQPINESNPAFLIPSNKYQQSGSNLAEAGLTLGAMAMGAKPIGGGIASKLTTSYENALKNGVDKGIKPSVKTRGKTFSSAENVYKNTDSAVKTILENQDNINVVDKNGEKIAPKNYDIENFSNAIEQAKKNVYSEYNEMSKQAGNKGIEVNLSPVYNKIKEFAQKPGEELPKGDIRKKYSKGLREYANEKLKELEELQNESPEIIEDRIKELNNSLDGYYKGTVTKDKAAIDAAIAKEMRAALDNSITDSMGAGYQDLKNKYGALSAIEKDVNHRATIVARRANKNVFDLVDPFAIAEAGHGLITMNPAQIAKGVATFGIKQYYKELNDPNRYIRQMFNKASKTIGANK